MNARHDLSTSTPNCLAYWKWEPAIHTGEIARSFGELSCDRWQIVAESATTSGEPHWYLPRHDVKSFTQRYGRGTLVTQRLVDGVFVFFGKLAA